MTDRLTERGFNCALDRLEGDPPEGWPAWSERQIAEADFVLVVFTDGYVRKSAREGAPHQGRGVSWEWRLIQQYLYDAKGVVPRFIPVVLSAADDRFVSPHLKGRQVYRLNTSSGFEALVKRLRRIAWEHYDGLFSLSDYRVAFIPLLNPHGTIVKRFAMPNLSVIRSASSYELPDAFKSTRIDLAYDDLASCRLVNYTQKPRSRIEFTISEIKYSDYLKSGEHLDDPLPDEPARTFREVFAKDLVPKRDVNLGRFALTNILGVGLFVVSHDRQVLICRHSVKSHVYPLRWTFSASGTMRFGASPNPFTEVVWKCRQEINHQIDPTHLELVELGADARKLFFECCFVEQTELNSAELARNLPRSIEHEMMPLRPVTDLVERIVTDVWEPAAEATLLMLALEEHGLERTTRALRDLQSRWKQHQMLDEWDLRASRHGNLAVMSVRYPVERLEEASARFVAKVIRFMGVDIKDKRVLEVGSGIGRITQELVRYCAHVTCIDLCERMHQRNSSRLGRNMRKVRLEKCFVQEFKTAARYDVAICCLVLTHNVDQVDFENALAVMCRCADVVFVFEDVTQGRSTSPHTRLLTKARLRRAFGAHGFVTDREGQHDLFGDTIAFLKFVRQQGRFPRSGRRAPSAPSDPANR